MYEQRRGHPRLRALHASPDAPIIDLYVDGALAVGGVTFAEVSDYVQMPVGRRQARAFPMGIGGRGKALLEATLELAPGQDYTLAVLGKLQELRSQLLTDTTAAPSHDRAKIRLLHASPDAPALDMAIARGPTLLANVAFGQVTLWQEVAATMADLEFRPSGSRHALMTLPDYTIGGGNLYTFAALGLLRGTPGFMIMPLAETVEFRLPM